MATVRRLDIPAAVESQPLPQPHRAVLDELVEAGIAVDDTPVSALSPAVVMLEQVWQAREMAMGRDMSALRGCAARA